jgi:hypothetical protein
VPGCPANLVFAEPTKSPNEAITAELTQRHQSTATEGPPGDGVPATFFCTVAPAAAQKPRPGHAVYCSSRAGAAENIFQLSADAQPTALFYNYAAAQLVCITSDHAMTTLGRQGGAWVQLSRMRFSSPRAGVDSTPEAQTPLRCVWTGARAGNMIFQA